jgi:hypothetical protein
MYLKEGMPMYFDGFDYIPNMEQNRRPQEDLHIVGVYDTLEDAQKKLENLSKSPLPKDEIVIIEPLDIRHDELAGLTAELDDTSEGALAGVKWGALIGASLGFLSRATLSTHASENIYMDMFISVFLGASLGSLAGLIIGAISAGWASRYHSKKYDEALAQGKVLMAVKHTEWERPVRKWLASH